MARSREKNNKLVAIKSIKNTREGTTFNFLMFNSISPYHHFVATFPKLSAMSIY